MATKANKKEITLRIMKSDYATLQEMKDDEEIVMDTEIVMKIVNEAIIKYRMKKGQLA